MFSQPAQRLGYFGGSFDPPHLGHLAVARTAMDTFSLDHVLLVPTGRQPLKPEGASAGYADRLAMVELLCQADPRLHASTLEAPVVLPGEEKPAANYTIDTLVRVHNASPETALFVIVGADAFHELPRWRSPELLLTLAEWIVVTRPHHAAGPAALLLPPLTETERLRVHYLSNVDEPASATAVRHALSRNEDCTGLLTHEVLSYIREHELYR
jgi:nicotinate-nucleotide adenylyltransferase